MGLPGFSWIARVRHHADPKGFQASDQLELALGRWMRCGYIFSLGITAGEALGAYAAVPYSRLGSSTRTLHILLGAIGPQTHDSCADVPPRRSCWFASLSRHCFMCT